MCDEEDSPAFAAERRHLSHTLGAEFCISDSKYLVHQDNLRLEVRGHRERQTESHAGGVPLDRRIHKGRHARELYDIVKVAFDRSPRHTQNGAVEVYVLAAGQFRMEAGAHL
jgi:hypothetical protein